MASEAFRKLHDEFSRSDVGSCVSPVEPYRTKAVATIMKWQELYSLGYVQIIAEPDEDYEWDGDGEDPCPGEPAFGVVGQYRLDPDHVWQTADSVWGHVGYRVVLDWKENQYILGIMQETIDAFRIAWKDRAHHRCPSCHGTGVS